MRDGVYAHVRRDGLALIVMYVAGVPVEVGQVETALRPKRLTRRRLGDTFTTIREEAARRRDAEFYAMFARARREPPRA